MKFGEKQQQDFSSTLYTGFGLFEVVGVNLTKREMASLKGYEYKEVNQKGETIPENKFEGKDVQGNDFVEIVFQLQNQMDKSIILPAKFRITDKDAVWESEENGQKVTKYDWVNAQGMWCRKESEKHLLETFTNVCKKDKATGKVVEKYGPSEYRKALQGEVALYNFMQAWFDKGVAFFGVDAVDTNILIDVKRAFRNIDKFVNDEFRSNVGHERTGLINALAIVNISDKDGKVSHFQNMYNQYWPEWKFKSMVGAINSGNWNDSESNRKALESFEKGLKKSAYTLGWLKKFDPQTHQNATNETFRNEDDSTPISEPVNDTVY